MYVNTCSTETCGNQRETSSIQFFLPAGEFQVGIQVPDKTEVITCLTVLSSLAGKKIIY